MGACILAKAHEQKFSRLKISRGGCIDANFYNAAFQKFQNLQANYEGLVAQAQASALAETPALYQVMTEIMGEKLLERRDFLFIALALALGGMVAVISALLWPARENSAA